MLVALFGCGEPDPWSVPGPDWAEPVSPTPAPASPLPPLVVEGSELLSSADRAPVRLRGLNVCSLEYDRLGAVWELEGAQSRLLDALANPDSWNVNAVRVPVNQQWFLEDEEYVRRIEIVMDDADRRGLYVLLDVHWEVGRTLDPYWANILAAPTFGFGNTTEAFWHKATSRWANRTNLLYDLVNEPHGRPTETARAMQVLLDRIRQRSSEAIVVVAGMDWAHTVDAYREHPLAGRQVVYSAHQYLPYDEPAKFGGNFLDAARRVPVILGELGVEEAYVDGTLYQQRLIEAAEDGGVDGWMPWAVGCGFGKDDAERTPPLAYLSGRMRALNR